MMRNYILILILVLIGTFLHGQNLTFGIANKTPSATNVTFDVVLSADTPFKLGSGQLYFNFNTDAFGEWVFTNNRVAINFPDGSVLGQKYLGFLDVYNIFVTNDNTANRFSFSWQQAFSEGAIGSDNITNTPVVLFQVVLNYGPGGENEIDGICFESSDLFDDQTFTACGPADPGIADCFSASGTQLTSDNFDCLISLPIELLSFDVQALEDQTSYLEWQTSTEINNDFFTVERAFDGIQFEPIERINGAGNSQQLLQYKTIDPKPQIGVNYYRLKQTDFDGTFTYSEIRTVKFEHQASLAEGTVFPNPATEFVYIRLNEPIQQGRVHLIDVRGQILIEKALTGSDLLQLTVDQMPSGLYWVRVESGSTIWNEKLMIIRE